MLIKRERKSIYWLIIIIIWLIMIIIFFFVFINVSIKDMYALREGRRVYHIPDEISTLLLETVKGFERRKTEIYGHILYVYTNQDKEIILVRGIETDRYKRQKIEEYFILRAPSTYQLIFSVDSSW
ncbi:MAG: hypothetical protein ACMUJM_02815 [bacterium]